MRRLIDELTHLVEAGKESVALSRASADIRRWHFVTPSALANAFGGSYRSYVRADPRGHHFAPQLIHES
jgi:hypothetical protein